MLKWFQLFRESASQIMAACGKRRRTVAAARSLKKKKDVEHAQ